MSLIDKLYLHKKNNLAFCDQATGAKNKNYIDRVVYKKYQHVDVYISVLDINDFNQLNNTRGHLAGDLALKTLVTLLQTQANILEICRFGGDEFIIVHQATVNFDELSQLYKQMFGYAFSYGTYHKLKGESCVMAVNKADSRLYEAKLLTQNKKSVQQYRHNILQYLDRMLDSCDNLRLGQLVYDAICKDNDDLYYVPDKVFAQRLKAFTLESSEDTNEH